ncbi:MAG TPA: DUF2145 domain-containing protein [Candidatus Sulfotelmatobacter sp.]|nr:DUF2145 domain-containing protein [Candidatus Sulfotelmatobacter sp.]
MRRLLLAAAILLGMAAPAAAGPSSSAASAPTRPAAEIAAFAKSVEQALASRGVHVAIVARIGRDPRELPEGLSYTHVAFWVYATIRTRDGGVAPGYAVFNLYQDDSNGNHSSLKQDFPVDFFADVYQLRAGVIVPTPELQARLLQTIASPTYAHLHNPAYSLVANPFARRYQNCTDFVLDVLTSAIYRTDDVAVIQADERAYFTPQVIAVGGLRRALAPIFVSGMHTDDQGREIRTATFQSLARFLQTYRLADAVFDVPEAAPAN